MSWGYTPDNGKQKYIVHTFPSDLKFCFTENLALIRMIYEKRFFLYVTDTCCLTDGFPFLMVACLEGF